MRTIIIAIDGPAGSGKSTTARLVAARLGYTYIDTGAMYRAITLAMLEHGAPISGDMLAEFVAGLNVELRYAESGQRTYLNGRDVSERIRHADVTSDVSRVSAIPVVRTAMVALQQQLARQGGVVMDGRDIGTVVFPDAELKIFMTASIEARAQRRMAELGSEQNSFSVEDIAMQLALRDEMDSSRDTSPLTKADDAIVIDTSGVTIEEQVERITALARERIAIPA
ncbi:MAG: (d)CMP kinase [Candidatus Kapabacteria bacterium]|nr:(d)CMP kinase [Candidatus Kapabacteria bacterium]